MISPNQVSRVAGLFGGMGATPDPAIPADPRQRTAMQQMGVTNPLLQQFGQSVAGLFGKADQMASPMQQANRAMQGLDPSKPESLLQVARALESSDPEKAVALRAKAAELVSAQRQQQQQQQARAGLADTLKAFPDLQQAVATGQMNAKDAITIADDRSKQATEDDFKVVGNNIFNTRTGTFLSPKDADKDNDKLSDAAKNALKSNATFQFGASPAAVNSISAAIDAGLITKADQFGNYVPEGEKPAEIPEISVTTEKQLNTARESVAKANNSNIRIDGLLDTVSSIDPANYQSGIIAALETKFKDVGGFRDDISALRTGASREINTEITNSLPKGAASDRDITLFSKGFPPDNAPLSEVVDYLQAAQRVNNAVIDQSRLLDKHLQMQVANGKQPTMLGLYQTQSKYGQTVSRMRSLLQNAENAEQRAKIKNDFIAVWDFLPAEFEE